MVLTASAARIAAAAKARPHWFSAAAPLASRGLAAKFATPARSLSTTVPAEEAPATPVEKVEAGTNRFVPTFEVIVSKIFPAGFGWQGASVVAGNAGMGAESMGFAVTTGLGDFAGVFVGHTLYSAITTAMGRTDKVDFTGGLWLGSAAFCSGTAWQPTVNFLHDAAGCTFAPTVVMTGAVTGMCFFAGLRIGRVLYAPLGLPKADYDNLCGDAMLSVSIGAATGTFVGTDISFADNAIRPLFGVEDTMSDLEGMVRAGASTSAGFLCMQSLQNAALPKDANWLDPVKLKA